MAKIIFPLTIPLFINLIFPLSSFAQTEEETMTITTYYPAPYGVYNEMRAKRMAVGTNYYNGSAYPWDSGGGCVGNEICNADLVVQGNVGIGTVSPTAKLSVELPNDGWNGYDPMMKLSAWQSGGNDQGGAIDFH